VCSPWFPSRTPPVGSALSSGGSFEASSPSSQVLRRCATPCASLAGLGCLRPTIPCGAPEVSLPAVRDAQPRAGGCSAGPPCRLLPQGGKQGLPGSRTTHCPYALFFDPGGTERARPLRRAGMAPAMSTTKALTTIYLSRLNHTARGLAVYASSSASPHPTQNSLPAAGQALPDGVKYPQGCYERFRTNVILLSRASPGARTLYFYAPIYRKCRTSPFSRLGQNGRHVGLRLEDRNLFHLFRFDKSPQGAGRSDNASPGGAGPILEPCRGGNHDRRPDGRRSDGRRPDHPLRPQLW
jgi:hypothetical protein